MSYINLRFTYVLTLRNKNKDANSV